MAKVTLFEDVCVVLEVDPDGKRFDKVSRIRCRGDHSDAEVTVDVNVDIYPVKANEKYAFALSSTLAEDGTPDDGAFDQGRNRKTLLDKFEYVMHGKVFKISEDRSSTPPKLEVYASFGGLLMLLKARCFAAPVLVLSGSQGESAVLKDLVLDSRIYMLMKRL